MIKINDHHKPHLIQKTSITGFVISVENINPQINQ